ncbi:MAE_28990/MAE_18760 family HEPN-like nuclease [Plesiomonas shigelloides]|uniref:MAE_28990/MAE_18760 family HEPN-like nuclease n=1 Tax=Plesiomonas shigelloides TaxID=703 RepID=UPI001E2E647F|nr:MAE_28990/MAE_18760 family HEPN-like nuclease [Plesiomonas shigelloides]
MRISSFDDFKVQLAKTKGESLDFLHNIKSINDYFCNNGDLEKGDMFRVISIPMIYSSWEGFFTETMSVCLNSLKLSDREAFHYSAEIRALWLQREPFFNKYIDMIKNIYDVDSHRSISQSGQQLKKRVTKGTFKLTSEVIKHIDGFNNSTLSDCDVSELVMTFSNVNEMVVKVNFEAINLDYSNLDLSQLGEVVGLRNSLGHGEFKSKIKPRKFDSIIQYVETLINELSNSAEKWLDDLEDDITRP